MVSGELHNEGSRVSRKHLGLFEHDARNDYRRHTDEISRGGDYCRAAEYRTCDHCDERYLCAAGDEGGGHDGHAAVTLVLDSSRSHDAGDAAAGAYQHRDE